MDCAMCGSKGLFQVEDLPVGPRWFCTEKHFAEYAGLPVREFGYYGFEAEELVQCKGHLPSCKKMIDPNRIWWIDEKGEEWPALDEYGEEGYCDDCIGYSIDSHSWALAQGHDAEGELERKYFTRFGDQRGGKEWGEYTFTWFNDVGDWKPIEEDTKGWDDWDYADFREQKEYELVNDMLSDSDSELYGWIENHEYGHQNELYTSYEVLNEDGEKEVLGLLISWEEPEDVQQKIQYYNKEPLHQLEFLAESKKLPPIEKAEITGITSGATMEGLDLALGAEEIPCEICGEGLFREHEDSMGDVCLSCYWDERDKQDEAGSDYEGWLLNFAESFSAEDFEAEGEREHPSLYWFVKGEIMERQREQGKLTENDLAEIVEIVATKAPLWMIDKGMREAEKLGDRGPWEVLKLAAINRIILEEMDEDAVFSERLGHWASEEVITDEGWIAVAKDSISGEWYCWECGVEYGKGMKGKWLAEKCFKMDCKSDGIIAPQDKRYLQLHDFSKKFLREFSKDGEQPEVKRDYTGNPIHRNTGEPRLHIQTGYHRGLVADGPIGNAYDGFHYELNQDSLNRLNQFVDDYNHTHDTRIAFDESYSEKGHRTGVDLFFTIHPQSFEAEEEYKVADEDWAGQSCEDCYEEIKVGDSVHDDGYVLICKKCYSNYKIPCEHEACGERFKNKEEEEAHRQETCHNCDGEGWIVTYYTPATYHDPADIDGEDCEECGGEGWVCDEFNAESFSAEKKKRPALKTPCKRCGWNAYGRSGTTNSQCEKCGVWIGDCCISHIWEDGKNESSLVCIDCESSFEAETNGDITIRQQAIDTIEARVADYTTHEDVSPYWGGGIVNPNKYLYFKLRYAWNNHPEQREEIIQQYMRGIKEGEIDPSNPLPHGAPNQHLPSQWDAESFSAESNGDLQLDESKKRTKMSMIRTGLAITTFSIVMWNLWTNKKQEKDISDIMDLV